jgi:hypothetical protein
MLFGKHGNGAGAMIGIISRDNHRTEIGPNQTSRGRRSFDLGNDASGIATQGPGKAPGRLMIQRSLMQGREGSLLLPLFNYCAHMLDDVGEKVSHI